MIVVTGSPRTGTSLVMQTLQILGVSIIGLQFHREFSNRELNRNGYWELPFEDTIDGITHGMFKGKAVKLFGLQLSRTPAKHISKVIVCVRDKKTALPSIEKLIKSEMWQLGRWGITPCEKDIKNTYDGNYKFIRKYLKENPIPHIYVSFENMLDFPELEIKRIADYVGSTQNIDKAIENVWR